MVAECNDVQDCSVYVVYTLLFPDVWTWSPWLFDKYHSDVLERPENAQWEEGGED